MADREHRRYTHPDWLDSGRFGREQGGSPAHRGRDYYGTEGRQSQRVSPGGEYLNRPPQGAYYGDGYTDQGYAENRGRSDWRTEDHYGAEGGYAADEDQYQAAAPAPQHRGRGPRGYRRSDQRIHEDVCDRLTDDSWIDASGLEVSVKDGEVTLSGTVDSRANKRRAEDLAAAISGVKDVHNTLRISSEPLSGERAASPSARH